MSFLFEVDSSNKKNGPQLKREKEARQKEYVPKIG